MQDIIPSTPGLKNTGYLTKVRQTKLISLGRVIEYLEKQGESAKFFV